ncbi:MAG TPA: MFS transporter, partial [Actinotalea caeni]|uniref:MFS transporter n=1 Tax=Actinotalea caeni TaxID=1348467 RepID=UPI002B4ADA4D
ARTIALAGNAMAIVTLLLQAHDRGVGTIGVAALLVGLALPPIAMMGVAGRLADTHDSRLLLSAGIGVQVLALVVLAWSPGFVATLAGVLLLELGQAVIGPVWTALLPRVVGEEHVGAAIAWQQGLDAVAAPVGAALGGILFGAYGAAPALLAAAAAFLVLWLAVQAIRTRRHLAGQSPTSSPGSTRLLAGIAQLRADRVVWPTVLALLPMVVMVEGVNAVEVFLARDTLGATPAQYGLGELAAGAGGVLGAAVAGRLSGGRAWVRGTIGGFAVGCGALAVAGAAPSFWVYLVLMVVVAGAAGVGNAANGALVITRTPDAQRGTVGAALSGIARTGSVLALALGGLLGTLLSPRAVFVGGGVLGLVVVLALGWRAVTAAGAEERAGGAAGAPATAPAPTATGTATVAADLPAPTCPAPRTASTPASSPTRLSPTSSTPSARRPATANPSPR